ncbi:glycine-rich protein family [Trichomonas vaginalis G3]|uniref:glycine-rich protein family n=1 Tax=Trichomonas vaginalis (strain ATCC PRA-98 / G3) TaxID=412133 RepID=UPI0021E58B2A|nr:glycine-rich protein family [Trichomonas vaginalis G3]KAI5482796.1 glycine-rich protein family [Trichomonas vaginalis G3]
MTFYLFVGGHTNFNYKTNAGIHYAKGGASSDIRLSVNNNFDWYDPLSLRSRIMVAAGGGSSESQASIGGNAGGLIDGIGKSDCRNNGKICPEIWTKGANQTQGGTASTPNLYYEGSIQRQYSFYEGMFGRIKAYKNDKINIGGMGGNGYYSGATLEYAGGGSGGSSFISGHKGCIALNSSLNEFPNPYNSSIHYSGLYFTQTQMISGNETMPLYSSSNSKGIGNKNEGCIRITILTKDCSCICNSYLHMNSFIYNFIFICFDSQ